MSTINITAREEELLVAVLEVMKAEVRDNDLTVFFNDPGLAVDQLAGSSPEGQLHQC